MLATWGSYLFTWLQPGWRIPDLQPGGGGGALVFEIGYHPCKKIHLIRVVFQDQAMYARTSFRGAKTCKIGKKGMFLVIWQILGKDMTDKIKKNACKNAYLGSIFIPEKYVFRVCSEILLRRWYPTWNTSGPPGSSVSLPQLLAALGEWSKTCRYCERLVTMAAPGSMPLCVEIYTATYVS